MRSTAYSPRRRQTRLTDEEANKFGKFAFKLERDQRRRFENSEDPYNFFESDFEQSIREDIENYRRILTSHEEFKKVEERQAQECPGCGYHGTSLGG